MAQAMLCDGCQAEPGDIIIQHVPTGDVTAVGYQCAPIQLRLMADAFTPPKVAPDAEAESASTAPADGGPETTGGGDQEMPEYPVEEHEAAKTAEGVVGTPGVGDDHDGTHDGTEQADLPPLPGVGDDHDGTHDGTEQADLPPLPGEVPATAVTP